MSKLIAFTGKQRSGKDTAAEYLSKFGPSKILKFADPLYTIEEMIYDYIGYPIPKDKTKRRGLLQYIGTEFGRETVDPNIWCKLLERNFEEYKDAFPQHNYFITDVRFPNEIELCNRLGFTIVNIIRDENKRIEAGATKMNHASENALTDEYLVDCYCLTNNGSLESFYSKLEKIWRILD